MILIKSILIKQAHHLILASERDESKLPSIYISLTLPPTWPSETHKNNSHKKVCNGTFYTFFYKNNKNIEPQNLETLRINSASKCLKISRNFQFSFFYQFWAWLIFKLFLEFQYLNIRISNYRCGHVSETWWEGYGWMSERMFPSPFSRILSRP